jgi:hypothetical protein
MNRMASFMLEYTFYEQDRGLTGVDRGAMHDVHSGQGGCITGGYHVHPVSSHLPFNYHGRVWADTHVAMVTLLMRWHMARAIR